MVHRYRAGGSRENKVDRTKYFSLILSAWLGGSIVLGWLLSFMVQPPDFITSLYSNFKGHVDNYELFCLVMVIAIFLIPFAFIFLLKYGLGLVSLKTGRGIFFLLAMVFLFGGLGAIGIEGGDRFTKAVRNFVYYFDWLGAVLVNFTGLFGFVFFITILLKNKRSY